MKKLRWVLAVFCIVALVAAAYLAGTGEQAREGTTQQRDNDRPTYDYVASDVVVQQMDKDGKLLYQMQAKRVEQLPEDGRIAASDLMLHYDPHEVRDESTRDQQRWTLTADAAELPENGNIVALQGNVLLRGHTTPGSAEMLVSTSRLSYNLDSQELRNDVPVRLQWGKNELSGGNLRANIKQGTVALESEVNGHLSP
jgi:LPS export ABC transporter protein LptC